MSRFTTTAQDGTKYTYGYDNPLMYYFLDRLCDDGFPEHLVGLMSFPPVYGSAHNLLEMCDRLKIALPPIHRDELLMDLPLSDLDRHPPLSGPEFADCDPDDSFIEDPPSEVEDYDSTLHHWEQK